MAETRLRIDGPEAFAAAFDVSRETLERLQVYEDLLRQWQPTMNLVSRASLAHVWQRHFADSAQLLEHAPPFRTWLDLGSGAGFPGLVIAILVANRQDSVVHLVESHARKCAFLGEVARRTGTVVEIHNSRIESLTSSHRLIRPDVISARALAPLDELLEMMEPLFGCRTVALLPKGRKAEEEIAAARHQWSFDAQLSPSRTEPDARIVAVRAPRRTGGEGGLSTE